MDRIDKVRQTVDEIILQVPNAEARRHAYMHLYGVSQSCALLALRRRENAELAVIAGMLHDIYTYANMDSTEHGPKGAELARQLLDSLRLFSEKEQELICSAIFHHSDKAVIHGPLDELLKDADVMQHVLHQPLCAIAPHEQQRFEALKAELGIQS